MKSIFHILLLVLMTSVAATAKTEETKKRMAVTALSENMMRLEADYESALETQSLMGTVVEIVDEKGYWRQVVTPEPYTAWCTNLGLVEMSEEEIQAYKDAPKYICTAHHSSIHEKPSLKSRQLSDISMGGLVRIVYKENKQKPSATKVRERNLAMSEDERAEPTDDSEAKVISRKRKWLEVMLPDGRKGWAPAADLKEYDRWLSSRKLTQKNIVKTALSFEGVPYLWGGASCKGFDCSGLVRITYMMNGYLLPRNASQQVKIGRDIMMECDHKVEPGSEELREEMLKRTAHLQPGDLVFFGTPETLVKKERITHVGIYIGEGRIIHASHKVRVNSLIPGEEDFYENSHRLLKARRYVDLRPEVCEE